MVESLKKRCRTKCFILFGKNGNIYNVSENNVLKKSCIYKEKRKARCVLLNNCERLNRVPRQSEYKTVPSKKRASPFAVGWKQ